MKNAKCRIAKSKKGAAKLTPFFVASERIFSNEFIGGLRKLHELKQHMEERGLLAEVA